MSYTIIKERKKLFGRVTLELYENTGNLLVCFYSASNNLIFSIFCEDMPLGLYIFKKIDCDGHFYEENLKC